jgi:hypothetical protein
MATSARIWEWRRTLAIGVQVVPHFEAGDLQGSCARGEQEIEQRQVMPGPIAAPLDALACLDDLIHGDDAA